MSSLTSMADVVHRTGVGASQIAGVLGISPWMEPWDVWAQLTGNAEPKLPTQRMRCGRAFQRPIAELFTEDTGIQHEWSDRPFYHPHREWQRVTVDAFIPTIMSPQAVLEVKTAGLDQAGHWGRNEPGEIGDESGVPEYYLAQVQYQMNGHGLPLAYIAVEINHELRYYMVEANADVQAFLLEQAEEFWRKYVLAGVEPPPGNSDEFRRYLKRRYPREMAPIREATLDEIALLDEYAALRAELKPKLDRREVLENELKAAVKDAAGIEWVGGEFTYKWARGKQKTDWEKLARTQIESYPADAQELMIAEHTGREPGYRKIHFRDLLRRAA